MSQKSYTTLQTDIQTYLPDNTTRSISAADVRDRLVDIVDSVPVFSGGGDSINLASGVFNRIRVRQINGLGPEIVINALQSNTNFRVATVNSANLLNIDASQNSLNFLSTPTRAQTATAPLNLVNIRNCTTSLSTLTNITATSGYNLINIDQPDFAAVGGGSITISNAATVYIQGPPVDSLLGFGDGVTINNAYSLWVDDGNVRIDRNLCDGNISFPLSQIVRQSGSPTEGQSLVWSGSSWIPSGVAGASGDASNADTLDFLNSSYFLDYANMTGVASTINIGVITGTTAVVFNEAGDDLDFRFEGNNSPNLLKLDAGLDQINIQTINIRASATNATWDSLLIDQNESTLTGSTDITNAAGYNLMRIKQPLITADTDLITITHAATLKIEGPPTDSLLGAGIIITNPYSLWISNGNIRIDGFLTNGTDSVAISGLTPSGFLNSLYQVDGVGSLLDADLLDGEHGSYYLNLANYTGVLGTANGGTGASSWVNNRLVFTSGGSLVTGNELTLNNGIFSVSGDFNFNGGGVFNEAGADKDFRVEGDTDTRCLVVDAGLDAVQIGVNTIPGLASSSFNDAKLGIMKYSRGSSNAETINSVLVIDPLIDTSSTLRCSNYQTYLQGGSSNFTGTIYNADFTISHAGSGTADSLVVIRGLAQTFGTGTITSIKSVDAAASLVGGTITNYYGFYTEAPSAPFGTITNAYGLYIANLDSTNVGNTYGIYINSPTDPINNYAFLTTGGRVVFNENGLNSDLRVEGVTNSNLIFVDASNDSIGFGTNTPSPSAILDISSTSKGLLIPRLTISQRNSIINPPSGLMHFGPSGTLEWFDGTNWVSAYTTGSTISITEINGVSPGQGGLSLLGRTSAVVTSGNNLYLQNALHYSFNGPEDVYWTLPEVTGNINQLMSIKNRGSAIINLVAMTGELIYDTTAVTGIQILPGAAVLMISDGEYFNIC